MDITIIIIIVIIIIMGLTTFRARPSPAVRTTRLTNPATLQATDKQLFNDPSRVSNNATMQSINHECERLFFRYIRARPPPAVHVGTPAATLIHIRCLL